MKNQKNLNELLGKKRSKTNWKIYSVLFGIFCLLFFALVIKPNYNRSKAFSALRSLGIGFYCEPGIALSALPESVQTKFAKNFPEGWIRILLMKVKTIDFEDTKSKLSDDEFISLMMFTEAQSLKISDTDFSEESF